LRKSVEQLDADSRRAARSGPARSIARRLARGLKEIKVARAVAIPLIALTRPREHGPHWTAFLFYHHVTEGQRQAFEQQLTRLRDIADLVNVDDALNTLAPGTTGRHVCLTFDDGNESAFNHALPILSARSVPATFFIVSDWIGRPSTITWNNCRTLIANGMTVASHGATHRRLAELDGPEVLADLVRSRERIELETGRACLHFACPWGQPGTDYLPTRDPGLAREAGYRSFFSTVPRRARPGALGEVLPRIRMEPDWGAAELRHAFSRPFPKQEFPLQD
jgi:peptidoglycan/xylan/chitin deacetylase (PgdA/CDA1 family)